MTVKKINKQQLHKTKPQDTWSLPKLIIRFLASTGSGYPQRILTKSLDIFTIDFCRMPFTEIMRIQRALIGGQKFEQRKIRLKRLQKNFIEGNHFKSCVLLKMGREEEEENRKWKIGKIQLFITIFHFLFKHSRRAKLLASLHPCKCQEGLCKPHNHPNLI